MPAVTELARENQRTRAVQLLHNFLVSRNVEGISDIRENGKGMTIIFKYPVSKSEATNTADHFLEAWKNRNR